MQKISSILPSNARLKSVDAQDAHPVRPGVPAMGRPVGRTSQDRLTLSQQAKDMAFKETLGARNPREMAHVKIADDMTRKFFERRVESREPQVAEPMDYTQEDLEPVRTAPVSVRPEAAEAERGSHLDTTA